MLDRTAPIESYLREAGMEPDDAHQWASYIQRIIANRYFHSGHPLTLYKDPETGEMRGLKYDLDENTTVTAASLGAGVLKAGLRPIEYFIRPIKMTFAVKDNFQRAAAENGIPKPIVDIAAGRVLGPSRSEPARAGLRGQADLPGKGQPRRLLHARWRRAGGADPLRQPHADGDLVLRRARPPSSI